MRALREFLNGERVRFIIERCRESPVVQGVLIQIDPRWLLAWRIGESYDPEDPRRGFEQAARHRRIWDRDPATAPHSPWSNPWRPQRLFDEHDLRAWRPEVFPSREWDEYKEWPIDLRICLRPREPRLDLPPPPRFEAGDFRILYETRPLARLYASPKDSHRPVLGGISIGVTRTAAGTLGGVLTDHASGKFYGVTCAHVVNPHTSVEQPSALDRRGGGVIGCVVASELPRPYPPGLRRIPVHQRAHGSAHDIALIEIDSATAATLDILKMGKVVDFADLDDIAQDEELEFTGRSSDWQKVVKSSVVPFYNLTDHATGNEYCYENPLVIREPSGAAAALQGDSGAWVCKQVGTDYHWAAMIVGGDRQLGFALGSLALKQWWEDPARGYRLSVT